MDWLILTFTARHLLRNTRWLARPLGLPDVPFGRPADLQTPHRNAHCV